MRARHAPTHALTLEQAGAASARGSRYGTLRFGLLVAATAVLCLSLVVPAVTWASYAGMQARSYARSPLWSDLAPSKVATVDVAYAMDSVGDTLPFDVVYLNPLVPDAPLPPGVEQWPAPGQVVVSPAMVATPQAKQAAERYGAIAGTIAGPGLADPGERLVYARPTTSQVVHPADPMADPWMSAVGFGSTRAIKVGTAFTAQPVTYLLAVEAVFLVIPAAWLLVAALRVGAGQRARRLHIVSLLGAQRADQARLLWGEARVPIALGTVVAVLIVAIAAAVNLSLPRLHFTVQSADVRQQAPLVVGALLLGIAVTCGASVSPARLRAERARTGLSTRHPSTRHLRDGVVALLPVGAAAVTVIACNATVMARSTGLVIYIYAAGCAVTVALLVPATRATITLIATWVRHRSWQAGDPGPLVGAAQLVARPLPATRFAATAAVTIVFSCLVNSFVVAWAQSADLDAAYRASIGPSVASVSPRGEVGEDQATTLLAALERDNALIGATLADDGTALYLTGRADDLQMAGIPVGPVTPSDTPARTAAWITNVLPTAPIIGQIGTIDPNRTDRIILMSRDGTWVDTDALKYNLGRATAPAWYVQSFRPQANTAVATALDQNRWLTAAATLGTAIMLVALWAGYAGELLRTVRALSPLQVLAGDAKFARSVIALRVLCPVAGVLAAGWAASIVLTIPMGVTQNLSVAVPITFLVVASVIALVTAAIAWALTTRASATTAEINLGNPEE